MQARPSTMPAPQSEIRVDRGLGGQIMRQTAPGTPCAQPVQDPVPDFAPGQTARAATRLEGRGISGSRSCHSAGVTSLG